MGLNRRTLFGALAIAGGASAVPVAAKASDSSAEFLKAMSFLGERAERMGRHVIAAGLDPKDIAIITFGTSLKRDHPGYPFAVVRVGSTCRTFGPDGEESN